MARIRRFDGSKIYNEAWDGLHRDLFFYLIGVAADNYGLLKEQVAAWAATIRAPVGKVQERIDYLVGQEVFFRYCDAEQGFLATRKWQDYQKVKYPGFPACPVPPPDILGRLSQETQELFHTLLGKTSTEIGTAVVVVGLGCTENAIASSAANPCEAAKNHYLDRLRRHTGMEAPEFPYGQASGFFARRVRHGDSLQDFTDTIDRFFDSYIKGDHSAGNFAHYQRVYNALALAVQKARRARK